MARRWGQITKKCLHYLNDLALLVAITLIDSHMLGYRLPASPALFLLRVSTELRTVTLNGNSAIKKYKALSFNFIVIFS